MTLLMAMNARKVGKVGKESLPRSLKEIASLRSPFTEKRAPNLIAKTPFELVGIW